MRAIGASVSNKFLERADYPKLSRAVELRPGCISPTMPKTVRDLHHVPHDALSLQLQATVPSRKPSGSRKP
jgi:hypothetical protein